MEDKVSTLRDKSKCREDNGGIEPQRVKLALQMFQEHQEKKSRHECSNPSLSRGDYVRLPL